jgi:hypothetical protein
MKYLIWLLLFGVLVNLNANAYTHQYPAVSFTQRYSGVLVVTVPDTLNPSGVICESDVIGDQIPCHDSIPQPNPLGAL